MRSEIRTDHSHASSSEPRRQRLGRAVIGTALAFPFLFFLLAQNRTEPLNIACRDGQCDIAFESIDAVIQTAVQAMHL